MNEQDKQQPSFEELCLYNDALAVFTDPNNHIVIIQDWGDPNSEAIVLCSGELQSKNPEQPLMVELEAYLDEGNETFAFSPRDNDSDMYIISRHGVEACEESNYDHLTDDKIKLIRFWLNATNWIKIDMDNPMEPEQQS